MFNLAEFEKVLALDNPNYARVKTSHLDGVVKLVRSVGFSAQALATEIKKVSGAKWQKYKRTRDYLKANISMLAQLIKPELENFKTQSMVANASVSIDHKAVWESDSGDLKELGYLFVREKVTWDAPSAEAKPLLDPAYQVAGGHFGVGNAAVSPGNVGNMSDSHDIKGAWAPASTKYTGTAPVSYTCKQVYQYSGDNKATWKDIPNSTYEIKREITYQNPRIKMTVTKYSVAPSTTNERCTNSVLL
jgi:hypothetical protein